MSKKLIILGAGASFGSESNNVPPLSNFLFNKLVEVGPNSWGQIDRNLALVFQNDFEKGMKEVATKYPDLLIKIQKSMAAFFVTFQPTSRSLYIKLAQKIKEAKWDGSVATLNYDRLLQISLMVTGLKQKFDHGVFPEIQVCYPHGCCNFFCEGVTATNGVGVTENAIVFNNDGMVNFGNGGSINFGSNGVTTSGKSIKIINSPPDFYEEITKAFPPVMSYFIPSKFTTSCKNFIENERNRFSRLIANADNIAIIGIKLRKEDKHIWNSLSQASARIIYCSGSEGRRYLNWAKGNRPNYHADLILNGYWDENFDEICSILEL